MKPDDEIDLCYEYLRVIEEWLFVFNTTYNEKTEQYKEVMKNK